MKLKVVIFLLVLFILSCEDGGPIGINSMGQVKLDNLGIANEGWGIGALVVSHEGSKIYYAVVNVQTYRHELRMIDANGKVTKLFSGDGQIDALDISKDDNTLLYSVSMKFGTESKLYEFPINTQVPNFLISVTGDGSFWHAQYLPNGDIVYTQGNGSVQVSLRRLNRISKEVTVLLDKSENPLLIDIDEAEERLLVYGWTSNRIMTLNFDGSEVKDYVNQIIPGQIQPVCFSSDGEEILAYQQGNTQASQSSPEFYLQAISYDVQTGEKSILTQALENTWPVASGKDKNEIIVRIGNSFPKELSLFNRALNTYDRLTSNQLDEFFQGFYDNSRHRILFIAIDQSGNNGLYILNK